MSWRRSSLLAVLCALVLTACGGASVEGGVVADAPAEPPKPRNAHQIASSLVGGQVDAMIYVDRLRHHPLGPRLAAMRLWGKLFDGTGIDPLQDLRRAYVTAPTLQAEEQAIAVGEHDLPAERLRAALDVMIARSQPPGEWRQDLGVPAAKVTVQGRRRVIALVEPTVLVVLPLPLAAQVGRFVGTGGCPDPVGPEAVVATAREPARTLGKNVPFAIPPSLRSALAVLTPTPDGGADLHVDAQSTSPVQAQADAEVLSRGVARATSVNIGFARLRVFQPVVFRGEQDRVKADRHLTSAELDRIAMLVAATLPR